MAAPDPLVALTNVLTGLQVQEHTDPAGRRCLIIRNAASGMWTTVYAVDDHFAIEPMPGDELVAIAPVAELGLAARRVEHQVAPASTAP